MSTATSPSPWAAVADPDGRVVGCKGLCAGPGMARAFKALAPFYAALT